jgi:hypothetical protein
MNRFDALQASGFALISKREISQSTSVRIVERIASSWLQNADQLDTSLHLNPIRIRVGRWLEHRPGSNHQAARGGVVLCSDSVGEITLFGGQGNALLAASVRRGVVPS